MTRHREIVVRATKVDSHSRKPRTYAPNRNCTVCPTILSIFNKGDRCSQHESTVFHKYRAVRKQGA